MTTFNTKGRARVGTWLTLCLVVGAVAALLIAQFWIGSDAPGLEAHAGQHQQDLAAASEGPTPGSSDEPLYRVPAEAEFASIDRAEAPEEHEVLGRLVDLEGNGVEDAEILQRRGGAVVARTERGGRFSAVGEEGTTFLGGHAGYVSVSLGVARAAAGGGDPTLRAMVVVARRMAVQGMVVDAMAGTPVAGARLLTWVDQQEVFHAAGGSRHTEVVRDWPTGLSGDTGAFVIDAVPAGARLWVSAAGFEPWVGRVPERGASGLLVKLKQRRQLGHCVAGRVVDSQSGLGVEDAMVAVGGVAVATDDAGFFVLDMGRPGVLQQTAQDGVATLMVVRKGFYPAKQQVALGKSTSGLQVLLEPGEADITGLVVDGDGKPIEKARVYVVGCQPFGLVSNGPRMYFSSAEAMLGEPRAVSDHNGEFVVKGLLQSEYELVAVLGSSLVTGRVSPIRPGQRATIVVSRQDVRTISGQVVDRVGRRMAGVKLQCVYQARWGDAPYALYELLSGPTLTTDEDGRFLFEAVGRHGLVIRVMGVDVMDETIQLEDGSRRGDVVVTVQRRCQLSMDLADAEPCVVEALDATKARLRIQVKSGRGISFLQAVEVAGATLVDLPDSACWLRVRCGNQEWLMELHLVPGQLNKAVLTCPQ